MIYIYIYTYLFLYVYLKFVYIRLNVFTGRVVSGWNLITSKLNVFTSCVVSTRPNLTCLSKRVTCVMLLVKKTDLDHFHFK
jgi:hypothetical protein